MTVEYLRYFVEVYRCGSVYQAARNIYITPQGISQGIKRLEETLHLQLFVRTQNGLIPTKFGEEFYPRAVSVVKHINNLEDFANDYLVNGENCISIGLLGYNQFSYLILSLVQSFQKEHPEARISTSFFEQSQYEMIYRKVLNGDLDVGWCFHNRKNPAYSYITITNQPVKCLLSADNPLSQKEALHWKDMKNEAIVLPGKDEVYTELITGQCERFGFAPGEVYFSIETAFMAQLVEKNQAVAFLYENFINSIRELLKNAEVRDVRPDLNICISLITSAEKKRTQQLSTFLAYLELGLRNNHEKW